jgi:hypothetical protein
MTLKENVEERKKLFTSHPNFEQSLIWSQATVNYCLKAELANCIRLIELITGGYTHIYSRVHGPEEANSQPNREGAS